MRFKIRDSRGVRLCLLSFAICLLTLFFFFPSAVPKVSGAPAPANVQPRPVGVITDTPAITIAGAAATTSATPTSSAREAQVQWAFGTVTGTYTSCTVQAKTSYDGTNYLTLGSAVSVSVASNALNAWTIIEERGTTSVTTSTASSTAALGFGQLTEFSFACSGAYGTSAPVTVSVIYR